MDMEITRANGETLLLSKAGVQVDDFNPLSIELDPTYEVIPGVHGRIDGGAMYRSRTIRVPIHFVAYDLLDVPLQRNALFAILNSNEPFYIRELRRPNKRQYEFARINEPPSQKPQTEDVYVSGTRYWVRLANLIEFEQTDKDESRYVEAQLEFETVQKPFAESIGTTGDIIDDNGVLMDSELWALGMNLNTEEGADRYKHTESTHRVWSPCDVPIDSFTYDWETRITVKESISQLTLIDDYGHELRIERDLQNGDVVSISRGMVRLNASVNITSDVKRKEYPALRPGWNTFEVIGGSVEVLYDFRFYLQ